MISFVKQDLRARARARACVCVCVCGGGEGVFGCECGRACGVCVWASVDV